MSSTKDEYVTVGILSLSEVNVAIASASVPAIVSLGRQLTGTAETTAKASYDPSGGPSRSDRAAASGQKEHKKSRWGGFSDVFESQASPTLVSQSNPSSDSGEFILVHGVDRTRSHNSVGRAI